MLPIGIAECMHLLISDLGNSRRKGRRVLVHLLHHPRHTQLGQALTQTCPFGVCKRHTTGPAWQGIQSLTGQTHFTVVSSSALHCPQVALLRICRICKEPPMNTVLAISDKQSVC